MPEAEIKHVMRVNDRFIKFLSEAEGRKAQSYDDATGKPVNAGEHVRGVLTIGVGHTGRDFKAGDVWSEQQIDEALVADVSWSVNAVNEYVKVPLGQNQFNALVSFVFNVGADAFRKSTLLKLLNGDTNADGIVDQPPDYNAVPTQLRRWIYAGDVKVQGLINRREHEIALWNEPDTGVVQQHADA